MYNKPQMVVADYEPTTALCVSGQNGGSSDNIPVEHVELP